jgi:ATP-dependent helicase/nuclease subunit A
MNSTNGYEKALYYRGGNLAVSASAGCGKTTSMINRIADIISKEKISISKLLVVTFTRAAAAEMKEKLRNKLISYPEGSFEYNQAENLDICDIGTIHSFCSKVCAEFFDTADIPPDFVIIEENDSVIYKNRILKETLESFYDSGDEEVSRLAGIFSDDLSDRGLLEITGRLCDIVATMPDPEKFLTETAILCCEKDVGKNPAVKILINNIAEAAENYIHKLSYHLTLCRKNSLEKNAELFESVIAGLSAIDKQKGINENLAALKTLSQILEAKTATEKNSNETDVRRLIHERTKELKAEIKELVSSYTEILKSACDKVWETRLSRICKDIQKICRIALKAYENFRQFKKDNSYMDFGDLEYYTLKILKDSKCRKILQDRYSYIFVDEFQDVNRIQDEIITNIEKKGNVFIVGDFKQSIYRFRGTQNEIFKEKSLSNSFEQVTLDVNFRSDKRILDFINTLFSFVMKESFSLVNYTVNGMLRGGCACPMSDGRPPVIITAFAPPEQKKEEFKGVYSVQRHGSAAKDEEKGRALVEAKYIADEIKKLINNNIKIILDDKEKEKRKACGKGEYVCYDDITILVRAKKSFTKQLYDKLLEEGIPVAAEFSYSLYDYPEITCIINYLKLIDNFMQDIPLLSSLNSPLWNFSQDEIAQIRLNCRKGSFCEAFLQYINEGKGELADRFRYFKRCTDDYAALSKAMPCPRLIMKIIKDTDYESRAFGEDSRGRLNAFLGIIYSKAYSGDVTEFLGYIENAANEINLNGKTASNESKVHLCTIHGSKGLEYPIVFLAGCGENFQFIETRQKLVMHMSLGLALDYYDSVTNVKYPCFVKTALSHQINYEQVREEINTLYVAMTRAKYRLYISGTANLDNFAPLSGVYDIKNASCYFDYILNVALQDDKNVLKTKNNIYCTSNFGLDYEFNTDYKYAACEEKTKEDAEEKIMSPLKDYKYLSSTVQPLKNSVTSLTKYEESGTPEAYGMFDEYSVDMGTAYHKVLSLVDFSKGIEDIAGFIDKLVLDKTITREQAEKIDINIIKNVLDLPLIKNIKGRYYREIPYIMQINASQTGTPCSDEILLQGVIDLLIINEEGTCRIVDYKYSSESAQTLKERYCKQLWLYAQAVKNILGYNSIKKTIINIKRCEVIELD